MKIPFTIQQIIEQAGGFGLSGALVYCGTRKWSFKHPATNLDTSCYPEKQSRLSSEGRPLPEVDYTVGLSAHVNGKRGKDWTLIVAYEPDDTYTVWLVEGHSRRTADSTVISHRRDVHAEDLQGVIEYLYDGAIKTANGGFIPIS